MPSASPTSFIMTNSKHLGVCEIHDYKKKKIIKPIFCLLCINKTGGKLYFTKTGLKKKHKASTRVGTHTHRI